MKRFLPLALVALLAAPAAALTGPSSPSQLPNVHVLNFYADNVVNVGTPSTRAATVYGVQFSGNAATATTVTTNANLTGPVTSVGNATSITDNAVTLAKMATVATNTVLGRSTAGTGNVEALTTIPTATLPAFTGGDVTSSAGSATLTLGNSTVTLAKMADMATASFLARNTAGTGAPEVVSVATARTMLSINNVENTALSTWAGTTNLVTAGALSVTGLTNSSLTATTILVANGSKAVSSLANGTANQVLGMNSGATGHEFKTITVGTSGSDFAVAHSANTITLNLPDAGASARGVVTTASQTFAGAKLFAEKMGIGNSGSAALVMKPSALTTAQTVGLLLQNSGGASVWSNNTSGDSTQTGTMTAGAVTSSGAITNTAAGAAITSLAAANGALHYIQVANTTNAADSPVAFVASVDAGSTGASDPKTVYEITSGTSWSTGVDNSDSDKFKICASFVIGTSCAVSIDTSLNATFSNGITGKGFKSSFSTGSVSNGSTVDLEAAGLPAGGGMWVVLIKASSGATAMYFLWDGTRTAEIWDESGVYSTASGTGSSTNLYDNAGTMTLKNNFGSTQSYKITVLAAVDD